MTNGAKFDRQAFYRQYRDRLSERLDGQGVKYWKPKVGINEIRILPNWKDPTLEFFKEAWVHWNVGENNKKVICPKTDGRNDCPVCATVAELYNAGGEEDIALARKIAQKERYAVNVLDVSGNTEGIAVFELGPKLFQDILFMFSEVEYGQVGDLQTGRNIKITREGTGMTDTKYSAYPAGQPSSVNNADQIMAELPDLDVVYKVLTNEEIEGVLFGDSEDQTRVGAPAESPTEVLTTTVNETVTPPVTKAPVTTAPESTQPPQEQAVAPTTLTTPVPEKLPQKPPETVLPTTQPEAEIKPPATQPEAETKLPVTPPAVEAQPPAEPDKSVQSTKGQKLRDRITKLKKEKTGKK